MMNHLSTDNIVDFERVFQINGGNRQLEDQIEGVSKKLFIIRYVFVVDKYGQL